MGNKGKGVIMRVHLMHKFTGRNLRMRYDLRPLLSFHIMSSYSLWIKYIHIKVGSDDFFISDHISVNKNGHGRSFRCID